MNREKHWNAWLCAGCAAMYLPLATEAARLRVPSDYPTIQAAIDAAESGDEIIVAAGTYNEAINFNGKAVYLHSADGPEATIIDAMGVYTSVVTCASGETANTILEGFTITGGTGTNDWSWETSVGGGMYNVSSSPTVRNCTFRGNGAGIGGGMYNSSSNPTVTNCRFSENWAATYYGGYGGGMQNNFSSPTVINCTFNGNWSYSGTGMYAGYGGHGAGMHNQSGSPTVVNCTFIGNQAFDGNQGGSGGGIESSSSRPLVTHCTFSENAASFGGGIIGWSSTMTVTNCILWDNAGGEIYDSESSSSITYNDIQFGYDGEGNFDANPLFVRNPSDGGDGWGDDPATPDFDERANNDYGDVHLSAGSPCIDAGSNAALAAGSDADGICRVMDGNDDDTAVVDMGPYESAGAVLDCNGNGVCDSQEAAQGDESDCNRNFIPDHCDIANGTSQDCSGNGIPDECEPDCNGNGSPDECDIANGTSGDCNGNEIPDECDIREDVLVNGGFETPALQDGTWNVIDTIPGWTTSFGCGIEIQAGGDWGTPSEGRQLVELLSHCNSGMYQDILTVPGRTYDLSLDYSPRPREYGDSIEVWWNSARVQTLSGDGSDHDDTVWTTHSWSLNATSSLTRLEFRNVAGGSGYLDNVRLTGASSGDCNGNGIPDECEIAGGTSTDSLPAGGDGIPDECQSDCNTNGIPDDVDLAYGTSADCNRNFIPDECDIADGSSGDCNGNGAPDACDMASGVSADCNRNNIPDECDIADGTSLDILPDSSDGIPDECQRDCNTNDSPDDVDIANGMSADCNGNFIPDECDIAAGSSEDCNGNGVPDECDIGSGVSADCNHNSVPDECDIADGTSLDILPDGGDRIPDECQRVHNVTQNVRYGSIQAALNAAVDGDEIAASADTYREAINFNGKAVYLHSANGPETTIIDATGLNVTVVTCAHGETAQTILEGFTITGGVSPNGGGMYASASSPTVTNCTFRGNSGGLAGGMYNTNSYPTVTGCTFSENSAAQGGGAMYNTFGAPTVANCTFRGNLGGYTGGMHNSFGTATVANCTFSGNSGGGVGGMYNAGSQSVTHCTFSGNSGANQSGGIFNISGSPTVTNCVFTGNVSNQWGGGMANQGSPIVINCEFVGNMADLDGGAMFNYSGSPVVSNCTFSRNSSGRNGGGMYNSNSDSRPIVTNCILWENSGSQIGGTATNVTYSNVQGGYAGAGNIDGNPQFARDPSPGPDGAWGTDDDDYGDLHVAGGSPCIDAGDPAFAPSPCQHDLDDACRVWDGNADSVARVDMGAYEFGPPRGDLDGDCQIGLDDLSIMLAQFGTSGGATQDEGDLDDDRDIDLQDLAIFLSSFGAACP